MALTRLSFTQLPGNGFLMQSTGHEQAGQPSYNSPFIHEATSTCTTQPINFAFVCLAVICPVPALACALIRRSDNSALYS